MLARSSDGMLPFAAAELFLRPFQKGVASDVDAAFLLCLAELDEYHTSKADSFLNQPWMFFYYLKVILWLHYLP